MKKNNYLLAATICAICDLILIYIGVLGVSALIVKSTIFKSIIGALGISFLLYYSFLKFKDFVIPGRVDSILRDGLMSKRKVLITALSFTLFNPHVYIDTIFLIGGYSAKLDNDSSKLIFGTGAGVFSIIWFYSLALFSSLFANSLSKERNKRVLSLITGLILGYLAVKMGLNLYNEIG